jgi:hypothetical protein
MGTTSKVFPNMVQSGKRVVAMGGSLAVTERTQRDYIYISDVTALSRRGGLLGVVPSTSNRASTPEYARLWGH